MLNNARKNFNPDKISKLKVFVLTATVDSFKV